MDIPVLHPRGDRGIREYPGHVVVGKQKGKEGVKDKR